MKICALVPCYNEEANLRALLGRLEPALVQLNFDAYEIVLVDDGSRDGTVATALALQPDHPNLTLVELSRNFGKEAALSAGLDLADADCVVVLDADLQHPPEMIGRLCEKWRAGADVVAAKRRSRATDGMARATMSRLFYRLLNIQSSAPIPDDLGDFRLMDRKVVAALRQLRENQRFMKGLYAWIGFHLETVEYDVEERHAGSSSFKLRRLFSLAWSGITSFSIAPLRLWSYLGSAVALVSFLYGMVILVRTLIFGKDLPGYPSLMAGIAFLSGLQILGLGVVGEYVGRTYIEAKRRPFYLTRKIHHGRTGRSDAE